VKGWGQEVSSPKKPRSWMQRLKPEGDEEKEKRNAKTAPCSVNSMRSQVSYWAAQAGGGM